MKFLLGLILTSGCLSFGADLDLQKYQGHIDLQHPHTAASTVYYIPVYSENKSHVNCEARDMRIVKDPKGQVMTSLCLDEVYHCALQGSCYYATDDGMVLFAYSGPNPNPKPKSTESPILLRLSNRNTVCPQGVGVKNICLDPYRSIAADPLYHKVGDVIFVPIMVGVKLPNGEIHDGFFTVRDQGQAIKGKDRFDFFAGFDRPKSGSLFYELGMTSKTNQLTYYSVTPAVQKRILEMRKFPMAPESVIQYSLMQLTEKASAAISAKAD